MYNSLFVSLIVKIYKFLIFEYNRSFLKKIIDLVNRGVSYLTNGSRFKSILISKDSLIEKSLIYSLYRGFMRILNRLIEKIRMFINKNSKYSLFYRNIYSLFSSKTEVLRTFFVFTLSFALGLLLHNIVRGYYSGRSYLIAIIMVIGSLIGISLKENYREVFKNSLIYRFIYSIFTIEEGLIHGS